MQEKKLNSNGLMAIEWRIHDYILERSKNNYWVSQKELHNYLLSIGINISMRNMRFHISNIRKNDKIQKIIVSNTKKGYKMLSDIEEEKYLESKKIDALKRLKQYWKDIERLKLNGQKRIAFTDYERDFIESMVK